MKQQPELEVTEQPTDWLVPYARNAKRHTHEQIDQICASIQEFGFNDPVAVWRNAEGVPEIVEGHGRVLAAKRLGMGQLPVIELNHMSDEQRRAYTHVHNQLTMSTGWEPETLQLDLQELPFDFQELGFDGGASDAEPVDFGNLRDMTDDSDDEYQAFVNKFKPKPKSTPDDCFTPEAVYDAVRDWACKEYGIEPESIVRPFYPGGDFENYDYTEGCVVVDNPPFSILARIIDFYLERGIGFFLFAPCLTLFAYGTRDVTLLPVKADVTYDNGAEVSTGFITNLDSENRIVTSSSLFKAITAAQPNRERRDVIKLPRNVTTASLFRRFSPDLRIPKDQCRFVRAFDSQKEHGKSLFGGGFLLSDAAADAAADTAAAAAAENREEYEFRLSEREQAIVVELNEAAERAR